MDYIAHVYREDDKIIKLQSVKEHSENTAELCAEFAVPDFKNICRHIGLMHDIGKYQPSFQRRIRGENIRIDHSICGAAVSIDAQYDPLGLLIALSIAGHHSGLPDCGKTDPVDSTLFGRLNKRCEDYSAYKDELQPMKLDSADFLKMITDDCGDNSELLERYAFLIKYCFSCLVDADTLDTMQAMNNSAPPMLKSDFSNCLDLVNVQLNSFKCETALQKARNRLQIQAFNNITQDANIYLMDMPTGSGKTLAGIKCALERALKTGKKRIIYVIP